MFLECLDDLLFCKPLFLNSEISFCVNLTGNLYLVMVQIPGERSEALAIAAPSPNGLPNMRVIITPNRDKNEKPISNYREGSYSIVN